MDRGMLARFLIRKDWFDSSGEGRVKQNAFSPPKNLQFSVTRQEGLTHQEMVALGEGVVQARLQKDPVLSLSLFGWADLKQEDVELEVEGDPKLTVIPDDSTRNHANICGWPPDKIGQMRIAARLAKAAKLKLLTA